jgi:hypothetical protein
VYAEINNDPKKPVGSVVSIAYGKGQFVGSGYSGGKAVHLTSPDGIGWVVRNAGNSSEYGLRSIAYGNGQFVATGDNGGRMAILTSADGLEWVPHQSGMPNWISAIAYGNGHFVAVGEQGIILRSGSIISLALTPNSGSGLLALSSAGPTGLDYTIQNSTDLISWQDVTKITNTQSTQVILDGLPAALGRLFYRSYSR